MYSPTTNFLRAMSLAKYMDIGKTSPVRIENSLRSLARRLNRLEAEHNGHLAVEFPNFWYEWRSICKKCRKP